MVYPTAFHMVCDEFGKASIPFVLVGGFAVNAHRVTRNTADADFMISETDSEKAIAILKKAGYRLSVLEKTFARFSADKEYLIDLDLLFVEPETLAGLIHDGREVSMMGKRLKVPSLNHLIALKLHAMKNNPSGREFGDLLDVVRLADANEVDVRSKEFRTLCLRYGTERLYGRIVRGVRGRK